MSGVERIETGIDFRRRDKELCSFWRVHANRHDKDKIVSFHSRLEVLVVLIKRWENSQTILCHTLG